MRRRRRLGARPLAAGAAFIAAYVLVGPQTALLMVVPMVIAMNVLSRPRQAEPDERKWHFERNPRD